MKPLVSILSGANGSFQTGGTDGSGFRRKAGSSPVVVEIRLGLNHLWLAPGEAGSTPLQRSEMDHLRTWDKAL
jgi:hypothetical protein